MRGLNIERPLLLPLVYEGEKAADGLKLDLWWAILDSNQWPPPCEDGALTS